MPISATGNNRRGITLMELMVVLAIIVLVVGISFPNTMAGLANIRLASATGSIAAFLNAGMNHAERRQQPVELPVSIPENSLAMRSPEPGYFKKLDLPQGISVKAVWPALAEESDEPRRFLFMPGGVPPRIGIEIADRRGSRRSVRVDPITGVPQIERPEAE